MRLHLTVTLPFGFFFLPLSLSLDISPNARSPWGPGECDAVQMPSQGVSGFTKGQVDVHSASGLFDARRVSAQVSWGSQERFASCRGLDKPQLISVAS